MSTEVPFHTMVAQLLEHVYAGKQLAFARALGVHESTVWRWHKENRWPRSRGQQAVEREYAKHAAIISGASRRYTAAATDFLVSVKGKPC